MTEGGGIVYGGKVSFEPLATCERASACPGWAIQREFSATLFLSAYDPSQRTTQPHSIAYPRGGQAMARRLWPDSGLGWDSSTAALSVEQQFALMPRNAGASPAANICST